MKVSLTLLKDSVFGDLISPSRLPPKEIIEQSEKRVVSGFSKTTSSLSSLPVAIFSPENKEELKKIEKNPLARMRLR